MPGLTDTQIHFDGVSPGDRGDPAIRDPADIRTMRDAVACRTCDLIVDVSALRDGQSAVCPRCGHHVAAVNSRSFERAMAFALASLAFLAVALTFPFLSFSASGLASTITLLDAPNALLQQDLTGVALLVAAFIIVIPATVALFSIALTVSLNLPLRHSGLVLLARGVFALKSWAMAEVFFIGVVVSLVKIAALATIEIGMAFWAYAIFTFCQTMTLANLDRFQCWRAIEELSTS